jgi:toxin ParE1/3/4
VTVHWSPRALQDLSAIRDYLGERSPRGAKSVGRRIATTIDTIALLPGAGRSLRSRPDIRVMPIGKYPYCIYYRVEGDDVRIMHIRHTSRRLPSAKSL